MVRKCRHAICWLLWQVANEIKFAKGNITVAHNCHGESKSLTAKANHLWQKQITHGKRKFAHGKSKFAHGKSKSTKCDILIAEVSLFCFGRSVATLHRRVSVYTTFPSLGFSCLGDFRWPSLRELPLISYISINGKANTHTTSQWFHF